LKFGSAQVPRGCTRPNRVPPPTGHGQTSPKADDIAALLGKRDERPAIGLDFDPMGRQMGAALGLRAMAPEMSCPNPRHAHPATLGYL
jgi:hypothetical protein